jgi:hypothetical protein
MALTVVEQPAPKDGRLPPPNPPEVISTPCGDPWPKPYFFQDGLRRVEPYHYTYNTNVKERWRGRGILDVFASEFRDRPEEYYVRRYITKDLIVIAYHSNTRRVEGGHRDGTYTAEWPTSTLTTHHSQEWRCDIAYPSPTRASRDSAAYRRSPRRR